VPDRHLAGPLWYAPFHVVGWAAGYGVLFFVSSDNHPTAGINVLASLFLVLFSAAARYLNAGVLLPALWSRGRRVIYLVALTGTLFMFTLLVVVSIRGVYRILWFDDPLLFGFWTNMGLDFVVVAFFVFAAAGIRCGIASFHRADAETPR
jgi:hypothetical protein